MTIEPIAIEALEFFGSHLHRPECVLCTPAGDLYCSDKRGGIAHIDPHGQTRLIAGQSSDLAEPLHPNGIALAPDGSFLIAHLGQHSGAVVRMDRDGNAEPILFEADGVAMIACNFVLLDDAGRLWVSVSTRQVPRTLSFNPEVADGFIVLSDRHGARIVADGIGFTNETRVSPDGKWLYVNETYGRRMSRFAIGDGGSLGAKEVVTVFGHGTYPDGLAFDADGGVWATSVVSNRLIHVAPDGAQTVVLEDSDPAHVAAVEAAYLAGTMERSHVEVITSKALGSLSSLAFGGSDLRTAYLGSLVGERLVTFRSPVAGAPMAHWSHGT